MNPNLSKNESRRDRSIYYDYQKNLSSQSQTARLEKPSVYRGGFSRYSITEQKIVSSGSYRWDVDNLGGPPMDYDPRGQTVYVDNSDAHTLVIGATGSKKSRLVAMPTVEILGMAGESMIICDPKAEIYERTVWLLNRNGYVTNVLNFRKPETGDGWNFLSIPYTRFLDGEIDKACEYINDMSITLMPCYARDPYWDLSARDLFVGLTLLLFYLCKENRISVDHVNMQAVLEMRMELFSASITEKVKRHPLWNLVEAHSVIKAKLIGVAICPEKTMSCILSTFDQHMSCFTLQPQLTKMLSSTTINFEQIGYKKMAIFLILPDEKSTYHPLATIFIKQIYEQLIDLAQKINQGRRYPRRVNFILDEFSSLPTISDFPQMITASRSRNLRFILIIQSKHQMRQRYREETETIFSNCSNWIFLFSRELPLLQEISELCGMKDREPLIPIPRLQYLDKEKGECLIFSGRLHPYFAHLADIDFYDNGIYEFMEITRRYPESKELEIPISSLIKQGGVIEERKTSPQIEQKKKEMPNDSVFDIELQKELEAKFDELFGSINLDDDEDE